MLALTATDTNGFPFIDANAGGMSTFKVDATGLTTIAGQGSGGATISDSGTTANTLTLTNSASTFNQAVLAMTSSDTDATGFSFIDAKAGSPAASVFTVDATGGTTITAAD
ncbi:hypothetical protein Pcac1_g17543 [Phytophthora cactorum]|nr:hypothetical protein Pcac1_g17543 [Phytophthora cactorum]